MLSLEKNNGEGGEKEKEKKKTRGEDESPKDPVEEMAPAHYVCCWRTACWETDGSNACVCAADLTFVLMCVQGWWCSRLGERERRARKKCFLMFGQRRVTDTHACLSTRDKTDDKCTCFYEQYEYMV